MIDRGDIVRQSTVAAHVSPGFTRRALVMVSSSIRLTA